MSDWRPDELATAGAEHLDHAYVAGYDAKAQFDPTDDVASLRRLGLGPSSTLLDLGAGTGTFALAAARTGASVTAVDVSPAMVASLRRRVDELGSGWVTVIEAGFLSYRHRGQPVDFVFSRNALHQLPDFWKVVALREMNRALAPGGVLRLHDLVFDVEPDEVDETVEVWLRSAADDPTRGYTAADFVEHLRSEFSTYTWLFEPMLVRAGFEVIDKRVRGSIYATYTCRKGVSIC